MTTIRFLPSTDLDAQIVEYLRTFDVAGLATLYRDDVLLDSNVPEWRFQRQGPDAVRDQFLGELAGLAGVRVERLRATTMEDGVAVEVEVHYEEDGQPGLWRQVHLIHTDGEAITEHVTYCTGPWDAATITRQAAEAPMIRP